ncbi:hypothetical protein C9I56_35040 [Paraburkholderia caribensis]|nr:hypothetical protein C9I56_35040 [Paraburkholderia caribensis]
MQTQSCTPYRGFSIDVRVTTNSVDSIYGTDLRYSVSWSILSSSPLATPVASLPEQLNFLSPAAAFSYGERRARTFIDGCITFQDDETGAAD